MGKNTVRRPRGTRDFGPAEMQVWRQVESLLRQTAGRFGYREIATPTFEHLDLFTRKSGEEIIDQLYCFEDKGGRTMALRPELTAAVMRFFSEEMAFQPKPVKVFYFGNCFRYERPQKGRYREFWQFGAESIGASSPSATAEIIALANRSILAAGLNKGVLRIGHLGILKGLLERLGANEKAVMVLIDKGNTEGLMDYFADRGYPDVNLLIDILGLITDPNALEKARVMLLGEPKENEFRMIDGLDDGSVDNDHDIESGPRPMWREMVREGFESLERVTTLLDRSGIRYIIDFGIARGLDYYTGIVFEVDVPSLGAEKQICGGGEYDLNEAFGLNIKGASGFAIGFDRLRMALEAEGVTFPEEVPLVGIIPLLGGPKGGEQGGPQNGQPRGQMTNQPYVQHIGQPQVPGTLDTNIPTIADLSFSLAMDLRRAGIDTELEVSGRGLKKALSRMNDIGVRYTIIIGEEELETGNVMLRDMSTGDQMEIGADGVLAHIREAIKAENGT